MIDELIVISMIDDVMPTMSQRNHPLIDHQIIDSSEGEKPWR
jgi:hypothetical protein